MSWILPLRNDFLTAFFKLFTVFGQDSVYLLIIGIGYWCFDKVFWRRVGIILCLSLMVNVLIKDAVGWTRPTIEHLVPVSSNLSFPSGDTQAAATFWMALMFAYPRRWFVALGSFLILGTACSRVYLGVHYPTDVLVGAILSFVIIKSFYAYGRHSFIEHTLRTPFKRLLITGLLIALKLSLIGQVDKTVMAILCIFGGFSLGFELEKAWVRFEYPRSTLSKVIAVGLGLVLIFGVKKVLSGIYMSGADPVAHPVVYAVPAFMLSFGVPVLIAMGSKLALNKEALGSIR